MQHRTDKIMAMIDDPLLEISSGPSRHEQMFAVLTTPQIDRARKYGRDRNVSNGEVLAEAGVANAPIFVVASGRIEIERPSTVGNGQLVATVLPGSFTGEVSLLAGRRLLNRLRVSESGQVIELNRDE